MLGRGFFTPSNSQPNMKATFDISLTISPDLVALSNMPVEEEEQVTVDHKVLKRVKFARTPIMSPYVSTPP